MDCTRPAPAGASLVYRPALLGEARLHYVDRRADIWAFGVVLHEALTGKRMFQRETVTASWRSSW